MRNLFKIIVSKGEKINFITLLVIFLFSTVIAFGVRNENVPFELDLWQSNVPQKLTSDDVWDGSFAMWNQGCGSTTDPYLIESAANLYALALMVNQGNTYSGKYFQLTTNLNLADRDWPIIGDGYNFSGYFDGAGYSITGVKGPLFGTILNANIKNLSLTISGTSNADIVGGLAKEAKNSTISRCYISGIISINNSVIRYCGGIVAKAENTTIYHCGNSANIDIISHKSSFHEESCAGIVADPSNNTIVHSCYNTGNLSIKCVDGSNGAVCCKGIGGTKCILCYNTGEIREL